jgi:hypothetical protein
MNKTTEEARQKATERLRQIRESISHADDGRSYFETLIKDCESEAQRIKIEQREYKAISDYANGLVGALRHAKLWGSIPADDNDVTIAELAAMKMVAVANKSLETNTENLSDISKQIQNHRDKLRIYNLEIELDHTIFELMRTQPERAVPLQRTAVRIAKEISTSADAIAEKEPSKDGWKTTSESMHKLATTFEAAIKMRNFSQEEFESAIKKANK